MEEQKQTKYKYLDQFIKDSFVDPNNIIYQEVEITCVGSVNILIAEQTDASILIVQGYSTSVLEPVQQENINRVHMGRWQFKNIGQKVA